MRTLDLGLTVTAIALASCAQMPLSAQAQPPLDPVVLDGQRLDPAIQAMLAKDYIRYAQEAEDDASLDPEEARAKTRATSREVWSSRTAEPPQLKSVRDDVVVSEDGVEIPVRIYTPDANGPLPIIVYYHGGGWFIGGIEDSDRQVRQLAHDAKAVVVSVEYRLSPEVTYPAAWNDAEDAFEWTVANADALGGSASDVCVGGDSAGGNMSIVVTSRQMDQGETVPLCQILYYPAVDNRRIVDMRETYESSRLFGEGFNLDGGFTEYILSIVFPDEDLTQPEISPLFDEARAMPPTLIANAGFDPLRDSQRAYGAKLVEEGNYVVYREFPTLIHGFIQHTDVTPSAVRASRETAQAAGDLARHAIAVRNK